MENQLSIVLSRNKLLKNINISKINFSGINGKLFTISEGEILYREGDNSDVIYLIISGEINLLKKRMLGKAKSYIFTENDFLGHEEYFEETSRFSTAVALRDSYLIALSRDEIDNLVNQNSQILTNLKLPINEIDEDTLSKKGKLRTKGFDNVKKETKEEVKPGSEQKTKDEDFFRSIADSSRAEENEIVQRLEEKPENEYSFGKKTEEDFTEDTFLNEDGIPKAEGDLSDFKDLDTEEQAGDKNFDLDKEEKVEIVRVQKVEEPAKEETTDDDLDSALLKILDDGEPSENIIDAQKPEIIGEELSQSLDEDGIPKAEFDFSETEIKPVDKKESEPDFPFEVQDFLNEDGIPKSEFELPGKEQEPQDDFGSPEKDVFQFSDKDKTAIKDIPQRDEPVTDFSKSDEDFLSKFSQDTQLKEKDLTHPPDTSSQTIQEPKYSDKEFDMVFKEDSPKPFKETLVDFEAEEINAEADEKLRKLEKTEAPESKVSRVSIPGESKKNADQLLMIIKAAELVNSTIKTNELLKNIVEAAKDLTGADRGTLYLVDREKNELWSLIATGKEMKEIRFRLGEGISGFVVKTGETLNIKDARRDPRFRSDFDRATGYVTKTVLTCPIRNNKGDIIGVLQLLNSKNGEFSKLDEELLNAMSIHTAFAIQNAEMVEKLLQSERIQSLGKMANFLIQDIKKPILVSKRYAEHLKSKILPPDLVQITEMLLEQLSSVADLVQTTSSYSDGKTILRTLNVSLNNTLADYTARIGAYVETRNCQIISEYDKDLTVKLDVKEFYQCYMHIVKNACDATPEGGYIYISTKRDDIEKRVKIFFRDNGFGIAESLKEKIFEPFFTQGKKESAGLGLSITKKIVEAHNGTIEVQSSLGEGTTFIITLPSAAAF